jgi:hypothetical protein
MAEPYFRLTVGKSEYEEVTYESEELFTRLSEEKRILVAKYNDPGAEPGVDSIASTNLYAFAYEFQAVMNAAYHIKEVDVSSGNKFTIDYAGEFIGKIYQVIDFSAGIIEHVDGTIEAGDATWAYCDNFLASYLKKIEFQVSSETLYQFSGDALFVWYSLIVEHSKRPALTRMLRETCFEFKWTGGSAQGAVASLYLEHPHSQWQAFAVEHPAMSIYLPYDFFSLHDGENYYTEVAAYSIDRRVKYEFNGSILDHVNVYINATTSGYVKPSETGTLFTWVSVPTVTGSRLMVEHWVTHKYIQRLLAINGHGFLIRQWENEETVINSAFSQTISLTKIIESMYLIAQFSKYSQHTENGETPVGETGAAQAAYYRLDPYYIPIDQDPLNTITIGARGNTFFKELTWDDISMANPFKHSSYKNTGTYNRALGLVTFAKYYYDIQHTFTYNSGFGPNVDIKARSDIFTTLDPGILKIVVQCTNLVLFFRGAISVRFN